MADQGSPLLPEERIASIEELLPEERTVSIEELQERKEFFSSMYMALCEEMQELKKFYSCTHKDDSQYIDDLYVSDGALAQRIERAKHRMEHLTMSQCKVILENCGLETYGGSKASLVVQVIAWRKERGDFNLHDDDDDEVALLGVKEVVALPSDMEGMNEATILQLGLLRTDLQLECLLRGIAYEASDNKPQLISKLKYYNDTLFDNSNTFKILQK